MSQAPFQLNESQAAYLREVLKAGNAQVPETLEMLSGQAVEQHSIRLSLMHDTEVLPRMGSGPLATVGSVIHGDIRGEFLFLQSATDFRTLSSVMAPALKGGARQTVNEATDYLIPDWLREQRTGGSENKVSNAELRDAFTELGNVLFGVYLMSLYSHCKLATYQDVPNAALEDHDQAMLKNALARIRNAADVVFAIEIDCKVAGQAFGFWLLLLVDSPGLQTILDSRGGVSDSG